MSETLKNPPTVRSVPAPKPRQLLPRIQVDWRGCFAEFCRAHEVEGGGFVVDGGRLVFGDGWTCAADSWSGPYWPPPHEPTLLTDLLRLYWRRRRNIVKAERDKLRHQVEGLLATQKELPFDLQVFRYTVDDRGNEVPDIERPTGSVDWYALSERLGWLERDVALCEDEMRILGDKP